MHLLHLIVLFEGIAMNHIIYQLNEVTKRFSDEVFLSNHGLSNEVGIHVFCYDPKEEMRVSSFFSDLIQTGNQSFHLKEYLLKQLQKAISPEDFVKKMQYAPHEHGDILLITGVGKVYPFMRSHNILDNLQHIFSDIPVVLLYPGTYNGQELSLFDEFQDGNYYRAFNMI